MVVVVPSVTWFWRLVLATADWLVVALVVLRLVLARLVKLGDFIGKVAIDSTTALKDAV